jgi:hypothetical protein
MSSSKTQSGHSSPHSECGHPEEGQAVRDDSGALPDTSSGSAAESESSELPMSGRVPVTSEWARCRTH